MVYENPTLSQKKSFDHYFAILYEVVEIHLQAYGQAKVFHWLRQPLQLGREREKKKGIIFV